ncbi:MAG: exosortase/archaeosortase family protein [Dysgonomonas sp.]
MVSEIKGFIQKTVKALIPFKDIIWFLFLFITLDFIWKLIIKEGVDSSLFIVLGKDLTHTVQPICNWTARLVYWVIHDLMNYENLRLNGTVLSFPGSYRLNVVWGCTGIKQVVLFALIIALYYGPWKKKLIFIPISMLILNVINVVRIIATVFVIKDGYPDWFIGFNGWYNKRVWISPEVSYWQFYRDWFQMFHNDIFKWLYYDGVVFLLWLYWQEKINLPYQKKKEKEKSLGEDVQPD